MSASIEHPQDSDIDEQYNRRINIAENENKYKRQPMLLPKDMTQEDIHNFIANPYLLTQKERKQFIK